MSKPSLTAAFVKNVRYQGKNPPVPERYNDGAGTGLYLNVMPSHSKQFLQRLKVAGTRLRARRIPRRQSRPSTGGRLGQPAGGATRRGPGVRGEAPSQGGGAPGPEGGGNAAPTLATIPGGPTFEAAFLTVLAARAASWKPSVRKHSVQSWKHGLRAYLGTLASKPVAALTAADIRRAIEPIWASKPKTAEKQLGRIGMVVRWAITEGLRDAAPTPAVRYRALRC